MLSPGIGTPKTAHLDRVSDNPCDAGARIEFRAGPSRTVYSIDSEHVVRQVADSGEELVGLCYFGDQRSREHIEAQLTFESPTTDS